jgi:hypothetical protein
MVEEFDSLLGSTYLMTSVDIRFFWLPLSTMKWRGSPSPTSMSGRGTPLLQVLWFLWLDIFGSDGDTRFYINAMFSLI